MTALAAARACLPPVGTPLLLAVSGGCDSMCLLEWLRREAAWPLAVMHLDHGLRPEAAGDAELVLTRCRQIGIPCHHQCVAVAAQARAWGCGLEEAGRRARYDWAAELLREQGLGWLLVAHHRDDQAETVLGNLLRGAGPVGSAGMPRCRRLGEGWLLRPWLGLSRAEIRALAAQWGVVWREDASNRDRRFRRNRLRHELLPQFEAACPGFTAALLAFADGQQTALAPWLAPIEDQLSSLDRRHLPLAASADWPTAQRELLWRGLLLRLGCPLSRRGIARLTALAEGAVGRRLHCGAWVFRRAADALAWEPAVVERPACQPTCLGVVHQLAGRSFQVMEGACMPLTDDPWRARIDASAPRGGLCWRTARPGERWQALGAPGHRSLFRWLGEHGVPERSRAAWIVLADEVGVLWVPGGTIAERARLGPGSRAALELRCDPALPARPVLQTAPP